MSDTSLTSTLLNRRQLLSLSVGAACALAGSPAFARADAALHARAHRGSIGRIGPLQRADANGVRLPPGFTSRIVARSSEPPIPGGPYRWHPAPDGGATFATPDGGWIYVSNSEVVDNRGGVGALRFSAGGELTAAYSILSGTNLNCAGGPTPWGTWFSCEEHTRGRVWECDPYGKRRPEPRPMLGVFTHEAVAVDTVNMRLYLTEDMPDGRWYRFTPANIGADKVPDLSSGVLEAAEVVSKSTGQVRWHPIPDPLGTNQPTRAQQRKATIFRGGEGCWYADGVVYFSTKHDGRIWAYDVASERLQIIYDMERFPSPVLTGVDNVTVSSSDDVFVAEDDSDMKIVAITPERKVIPVLQVPRHVQSEIAGPAFDPSGTRLYFSSQRGETGRNNGGMTFEVTGPFNG